MARVLSYHTPPRTWRRLVPGWRAARRVVQLAFVVLFLWLFRATAYPGADLLAAPVNVFFRMDPLAAAAAMLAGRAFLYTFWPALIVLALTVVFGRFFCGWVCPAGTLLDWIHRLLRPLARHTNRWATPLTRHLRPLRYVLLVFVLLAALLAVPLVGYLDPFALLTRGLTQVVDPAFTWALEQWGVWMLSAPHWIERWGDPLYTFLRDHVAAFQQASFALVGVTAGILVAIVALELVGRRFWCRYVCPLGAAFGPFARWSLARRLPTRNCGKCPALTNCTQLCRMDAFDGHSKLIVESCNLCMDCIATCPTGVAKIRFNGPKPPPAPLDLSRRAFLTTAAFGVAAPLAYKASGLSPAKRPAAELLRPPGAADEHHFLNRCIRCGECLKVCPTNGLQPAALLAGLEGIFSPVLVPRQGYCEYGCTLCAQVCPTAAIPLLPKDVKRKVVIGKAVFDHDRCLPWATNEECLCCEEHCPLPEKAIWFEEVQVQDPDGNPLTLRRPHVHYDLCIGCGICENKCPLDGASAIVVKRAEYVAPEKGQQKRLRRRGGRG